MTFAQRQAARRLVQNEYARLIATRNPAPMNALWRFARSRSEFRNVTFLGTSLAMQYRDGRPYLFIANRVDRPESAPASLETGGSAGYAPTTELPNVNPAVFIASNDMTFVHVQFKNRERARQMREAGWRTETLDGAFISNLQRMNSAGFVYFGTHGSPLIIRNTSGQVLQRSFGLMVDLTITEQNDRTYGRLMTGANPQMFEGDILVGINAAGRPVIKSAYAVTPAWIRANLRLRANRPVVILDACLVGSPEGADMRKAFHDVGAQHVFAWVGSANARAYRTVDTLIDRSVGANRVQPKDPPQRSFPIGEVWTYMVRNGLHRDEHNARVFMQLFTGPGANVTLLRPHIYRLSTDLNNVLEIEGSFGDRRLGPGGGRVTVGGTDRTILSWTNTQIRVQLPPRNAFGEVVVYRGDVKSRPRILTEYTFRLTQDFNDGLYTELTQKWVIDVVFRADIYGWRKQVDQVPILRPDLAATISGTTATSATHTASGTWRGPGGAFITWSGTGTMTGQTAPGTPVDSVIVFGVENLERNRIELLVAPVPGAYRFNVRSNSGSGPAVPYPITPEVFTNNWNGEYPALDLPLNGQRQLALPRPRTFSDLGSKRVVTFSNATMNPPYDPKATMEED